MTPRHIFLTAMAMMDNLDYAIEYDCDTVAEYILYCANERGDFDYWEDDVEGCTPEEFKKWVNDTYDFSPNDPQAEEWIYNIFHNL